MKNIVWLVTSYIPQNEYFLQNNNEESKVKAKYMKKTNQYINKQQDYKLQLSRFEL